MTSKTKCFVSFGEMNPFVFAVLAASAFETKRTVVRWAMELAGLGDLRARRPSKGRHSQASSGGAMRSIASRRAVRSDQRLRCGSGAFPSTSSGQAFEAARRRFRTRFGQLQGTKKLRRSALKSLKQLVRVNLCATPTEGSQADDSR